MVIRLLDLFSGIGGFSYAAEKLVGGYETVAFCEQDEFCQQVLRKHWKDVPIYDDVRTIDATGLGNIDIVAGGFPCQAVSQAGLQKATEDDRWLWDEMLRIIQDCKPRWVIGENVVGLININQGILFEQVQTDLEKEGYSVQSVVIPAASKNAPHRRDRVWIIANTNNTRNRTSRTNIDKEQQTIEQEWKEQSLFEPSRHNEVMADTENRRGEQTEWQGWESSRRGSQDIDGSETEREEAIATDVPNTKRRIGETQLQWQQRILRKQNSKRQTTRFSNGNLSDRGSGSTERRRGYMANGISEALSGHFSEEPADIPRVATNQKDRTKKLKALGNSIVPQVAAELFYAIRIAEYGE